MMTKQRKEALEARLDAMVSKEIRALVARSFEGTITADEVATALVDLSEIKACIGSAYRALGGVE